MSRTIIGLCAVLMLAACAAQDVVFDPPEKVAAARYVDDGPPSITLFTVVSTRTGAGGHTGLLINASQRVMFDPAGTWYHPNIPEQNDVHFGITDRIVNFYIDYHARETFDVVEQTVVVTPAQAEVALRRAREYGAVPKAQCARSVSAILRGVPGFEGLPSTWFPVKLSDGFAQLPGVTTRRISDDDADDNHGVLMVPPPVEPPPP